MNEDKEALHTCECGAKLRVPGDMAGKTGVCPVCGAKFELKNGQFELKEPPAFELDPGQESVSAATKELEDMTIDWDDDDQSHGLTLENQPVSSPESSSSFARQTYQSAGGQGNPAGNPPEFANGAGFERATGGPRPWDKPPKSRVVWVAPVIVVCLIAAAVVVYGFIHYAEQKSYDRSFAKLMANIAAAERPEEKKKLLSRYIETNAESPRLSEAQRELQSVEGTLATRDYYAALNKLKETKGAYEQKMDALHKYLKDYPDGAYTGAIKEKLKELEEEKAARDYERTQEEFDYYRNQPAQAELALKRYLRDHPEGERAQKVKGQLAAISTLWEDSEYNQTVLRMKKYGDQYEKAVETGQQFLADYPQGKRSREMTDLLADYQSRIEDRDYGKALKAQALPAHLRELEYRSYLSAHPRGKHAEEIKGLLESTNTRSESGDGLLWRKLLAETESSPDPGKALAAMETYLRSYPRGAYAGEARQRIADLKQ